MKIIFFLLWFYVLLFPHHGAGFGFCGCYNFHGTIMTSIHTAIHFFSGADANQRGIDLTFNCLYHTHTHAYGARSFEPIERLMVHSQSKKCLHCKFTFFVFANSSTRYLAECLRDDFYHESVQFRKLATWHWKCFIFFSLFAWEMFGKFHNCNWNLIWLKLTDIS